MKRYEITLMDSCGIEELLKSKKEYKTAVRLVSILPLSKGESSRKAQELLLLSHNQILIWAKRFNQFGIEGLRDKPKPGRKPKIRAEQLSQLKRVVLEVSPEEYGYNTAVWAAPMLVKVIEKEFGIHYSDDAVYFLLKKKLGLSYKKGRGFYPEADPKKRKEFSDTLKKTP